MKRVTRSLVISLATSAMWLSGGDAFAWQNGPGGPVDQERSCLALENLANLTILSAKVIEANGSTPRYCYVRGLISPAIHYHVQLPFADKWNGRFLMWGDGGQDGDLDFADHRLAQGYAVANSNSGHDEGSEPGSTYAFNNRQGEIDFAYRAVHLTVNAARTMVEAYYRKAPQRSYFEGCSTGGRQGLMEAQRFPNDFDGIVAGAPTNFTVENTVNRLAILQRLFRENFAANLASDTNGDGSLDSIKKVEMLRDAVLNKCDAVDGIRDGVIDDPLRCTFDPKVEFAAQTCSANANRADCFTSAQLQSIEAIYQGARDSKGRRIHKGPAFGSETAWERQIIPHAGNKLLPDGLQSSGDRLNYMFYENDPGTPPADFTDINQKLDKKKLSPEWGWWEFNVDDLADGRGKLIIDMLDAKDPNLSKFLKARNGKLILYHGWADPQVSPEPTVDYYKDVLTTTFAADTQAGRERARLFMIPGMGHCGGGAGPNTWDKLAPLVDWVENGKAPEHLVATHGADGKVDNERKICAYPQRAVYSGPAGGENDRANWVQGNFTCR